MCMVRIIVKMGVTGYIMACLNFNNTSYLKHKHGQNMEVRIIVCIWASRRKLLYLRYLGLCPDAVQSKRVSAVS